MDHQQYQQPQQHVGHPQQPYQSPQQASSAFQPPLLYHYDPSSPQSQQLFAHLQQLPGQMPHHLPQQQQFVQHQAHQLPSVTSAPTSWQEEENQKRGFDNRYLRQQQQLAQWRERFMQLSPQQQHQVRQQLLQRKQQLRVRELWKQWKLQQMLQLKEKALQAQQLQQQQLHHQMAQQAGQGPHQSPVHRHHQPQQTQQQSSPPLTSSQSAPISSCVPAIVEEMQRSKDGASASPKLRRLSSFRRGRIAPIKKKSFKPGSGLSSSASACTTAGSSSSTSPPPPSSSSTSPSSTGSPASATAGTSFGAEPPLAEPQPLADGSGAVPFRRARSFSDPSSTWPVQQRQLHQLQQLRQQQQLQQQHHQHQQMQRHMLHQQQQHQQQQQQHHQQMRQQQQRRSLPVMTPLPQHQQQQQNVNPHHPLLQRPMPTPQQHHQHPFAAPFPLLPAHASPHQARVQAGQPQHHGAQQQPQPVRSLWTSLSEPSLPTFGQRRESMELESGVPSLSFSTASPSTSSSSILLPSSPQLHQPFQSLSSMLNQEASATATMPSPPIADALNQLNLGEMDPNDSLALEMIDDMFIRELMGVQQQQQGNTLAQSGGEVSGEVTRQPLDGFHGTGDIFEELGEIISLPDDLFEVATQTGAGGDSNSAQAQPPGTPDVSSFGSPSLLPASPSSGGFFYQIHA